MMRLVIFLALFLSGAAGLVFLIYNIKQFHFVDVLSRNKKAVGWIISTLIVILHSAIIWNGTPQKYGLYRYFRHF